MKRSSYRVECPSSKKRSKSQDLRHFFRYVMYFIVDYYSSYNKSRIITMRNLITFRASTTGKESHSSHSTTDITSGESVTTDQCSPGPSSCISTVNPLLDAEPCSTTVSESVPDSHSAIASGDFGEVVKLKGAMAYNLTDMNKYKLLTEHYIPTSSHPFPARTIGGTVRHFQHSWLTKYPGLVYSLAEEGDFVNIVSYSQILTPQLKNWVS